MRIDPTARDTHPPAPEVSLHRIREAGTFLVGRVERTPILSSTTAAQVVRAATGVELADGRLYAKAEHLQRTGSYKVRGATFRIARLSAAEHAAGVIGISAGNHAAAVAVAAGLLGVHAVVVMPVTAVRSKVAACRGYGAEVILEGEDTSEAWAAMERIRDARGLTFIHPFDHPDTVAGQGTIGLEIVEDLPDVDVVVAGVGGGGMACGVGAAVKGLRPGARVYGVEPRTSNALTLGLAAGLPVHIRPVSVADGLNAPFTSATTISLARRLLAGIVLLDDAEILAGMRFAAERMKQVLEPAGAAALAAVVLGRVPVGDSEKVCVVLSGGNVDVARLGDLIALAGPVPGA
ncbi:MAG TPA: pyridoxal-phosphate dependent enzyme [Patescibacteria group bacterium]|nr:pyridoxal-phosphate dependent enzyme [Patescibacteria group bacterium]